MQIKSLNIRDSLQPALLSVTPKSVFIWPTGSKKSLKRKQFLSRMHATRYVWLVSRSRLGSRLISKFVGVSVAT